MGKWSHKMKNMFKSPEQIEIEAKMQFNKNKRAFTKYYQELDGSIRNFSKMARDAELSGNHANAKACAGFVLKLQKTQIRVQGLLQRFEMMYSMQRLTGVMTNFMDACADMGFNMDESIDLKKMWKNTAEMDKALGKLDAMSDQMDMVFDAIDNGMSNGEGLSTAEEHDAEAEQALDQIMGRFNDINAPASANAASNANGGQADADAEEKLRSLMQNLNKE